MACVGDLGGCGIGGRDELCGVHVLFGAGEDFFGASWGFRQTNGYR